MRYVLSYLGLIALALALGCTNSRLNILRGPEQQQPIPQEVPTTAQLVKYMEDNAQRIQSLKSDDLELTVSMDGTMPVNLSGLMACQRGRRFRMQGRLFGPEVDIGSNEQEFWYWIKRAEPPYQAYCSYQALNDGLARHIPFPFQPDWVMETLGMGNYGPAERYQLVTEPEKFKLVEKVRGPQGNPVRKVIVFQRRPQTRAGAPVITEYQLLDDANGQMICSAYVHEIQGIQGDPKNGWVPRRLELRWPAAQNLKLSMKFTRVQVNPQLNGEMFVRAPLSGVPSINLATGQLDGQPNAFRRAGGGQ